jgi:hypothetical protein
MNTQINDQHRATEPSVAEMANMMNFGGGHNRTADQHDDENAIFDVEAIEDENEDEDEDGLIREEFNPEKNATKVGFRKNGLAKGTLVGVTGLVAVVAGLTFFQGQVPKDKVAEAPQKKDAADDKVEVAQSDATKAQQSESEIKAELALSKQKDALEQSNGNKTNDPSNSKTTDKLSADPNTKVASSPAPSVPIVPPVKPTRAGGFVTSPIVPPLAIPPSSSTRVATAPAPTANRNNISIPPAGIQPLQNISAARLATAPVGSFLNKNTSSAPKTIPNLPSSSIKAIAQAPGIAKAPVAEPVISKAPVRELARVEPTRKAFSTESPTTKRRPSEELSRLPIAPAPGVPVDTEIASSTLPATSLPVVSQPGVNPNTIPPVAINTAPSLTDFLKKSIAADHPPASIPVVSTQLVALNKDQSKEKHPVTTKDPKAVLQAVFVPTNLASSSSAVAAPVNKNTNLIAANDTKNIKHKTSYSGLVSPNSLLTDIINAPSLGVAIASANVSPDTVIQAVKPALTVAPGTTSTRPAYAHTRMLLAGLPDANISLGNVEQVSSQQNVQVNQANKSQVVTQSNPVLNQPAPATPEQNVPGTPVSPVSPIGPIAASILTGTSAKGTTLTPILWGSDSANGAKFIAKLEEPLLANNKREALPAGTQLVVMARSSNNGNSASSNSNSSLVEVDVVGVIVQGKEYATPPGAIVIHDENNGLLVGEDYFKREDQIASRDYLTVLGGALNTLGQVLNRPSGTFSSNTSGFGSSSTNVVNNRDPNAFGALLEGGFKDIPGIWSQRNQQALAQLASQPKVYQIPKGRTIRVFVNQSIIF